MPLVTLKCREQWYPNAYHDFVSDLAEGLPQLMTKAGEELLLDEDTPPEAVQVDVQKFDRWSVNVPDVWICILFTEDPAELTQDERLAVRDKLIELIKAKYDYLDRWRETTFHAEPKKRPTIALDVFWGPGHGCMMDESGTTTTSW